MADNAFIQRIILTATGCAAVLIAAGCASPPAQPAAPATGATSVPAASPPTGAAAASATKSVPAASPAVSPAAGKAASGTPIVIFMPLPFTGPTADIGLYWNEGAKVAVQEINESGGILGRPIDFRVADDQAKPDVYVRLIREFAGQGGNLVFGGSGSAGCLAAAPVLVELNVVLLATACQTTKMTAENYVPNFFRATTNAEITSRSAAMVMNERFPTVTKWSTISPDYEYGHNTWEIFAKQMKALNPGLTVVKEAFPPFLSPTFQSYVTSVQSAQPEGMFSSLYAGDMVNMVKQAEPFGFLKSLKANVALGDLDTAVALGKQQPDQWLVTFWNGAAYDNAESKRFVEGFRKMYNKDPTAFNLMGYIGPYIYKAAIEKAGGKTDTASIIKALEEVEVMLPEGRMSFRKEDHQMIHPTTVLHVTPANNAQGWQIAEFFNVPGDKALDPPHPGQPGNWP